MSAEFEEFAALWAQEPDAEERRIFAALARTVSRRAKMIYYIELGLALFLGIGVLAALFLDQRPATTVLVLLVIGATAWLSWKRYNLQQVAMIADHSDRERLLKNAIASAEGRLRYSTLSLQFLVPGFFLGLALRGTVSRDFDFFFQTLWDSFIEPLTLAGAVAVVALLLYFGYNNLQLRRQLERLRVLQAQYRQEAILDDEQKNI